MVMRRLGLNVGYNEIIQKLILEPSFARMVGTVLQIVA